MRSLPNRRGVGWKVTSSVRAGPLRRRPDELSRNEFRQTLDFPANWSTSKPSKLINNIVGFNQQFVDIYRRSHKVSRVSDRSRQAEYTHASRGRRASHHAGDDREQAILATAERLLEQRPLADFSVDDLAKGAGISRPTFYFYFRSKNAVLLSLLDQMNTKAHAALNALGSKLPGNRAAAWRDRIEAFFEVSGSHRAVAVAGAAAKATNPEVRQLGSTPMQKGISYPPAAIQTERERGAAPHTVPAADLSVALNMLNERVMTA